MANTFTKSINTVGGVLHIPNYLLNSKTGNVPAPIQAGSIYGPVAPAVFQTSTLRGPANPNLLAAMFNIGASGYSPPK